MSSPAPRVVEAVFVNRLRDVHRPRVAAEVDDVATEVARKNIVRCRLRRLRVVDRGRGFGNSCSAHRAACPLRSALKCCLILVEFHSVIRCRCESQTNAHAFHGVCTSATAGLVMPSFLQKSQDSQETSRSVLFAARLTVLPSGACRRGALRVSR